MTFGSIRVRLTAWYLIMLAIGLGGFGVGSWFAMRASAFHAIDEELKDRIRGIQNFMEVQIASLSPREIRDEFREHSVLGPGGDLFQVCNDAGEWLYRSASLENNQVPIRRPNELGDAPKYENLIVQGLPVRFASVRSTVNGSAYTVQVAAPQHEFNEALERFRLVLWLSVPLVLALATVGGYCISRRALKPVDQIAATADSISIQNLSARLQEPGTGDELQRLSETLNRMLTRLNDSVQRMSQFTADASHELRAPVSLIRTTAELAVSGGRTNAEYHEDMAHILAEAERTSRLIDSLLFLARADAGEDGLQREPMDFATSVREAVEQAHLSAVARHINLSSQTEAAVVLGDVEALRRLVFILVDNAIKYNNEGGTVDVRVTSSPERVTCIVRDSGIGIAPEEQQHIFDRFWRADKVRSRGTGGVGLGLSIARWIVARHQGTIAVKSNLQMGTTVTVTLPSAVVSQEEE
jgi:heavy metal sensor kinase